MGPGRDRVIADLLRGEGTDKRVALILRGVLAVCGAAVVATALPLLAWPQSEPDSEKARKRLEADKGRLDATQRRSQELEADLDKIAAERQRINARLLETGKLIHLSEAQLSLIESRLGELEAEAMAEIPSARLASPCLAMG